MTEPPVDPKNRLLAGAPISGRPGPAADPGVDLKNRYLAGLLARLVPGLGHWYQGRRFKAGLYFLCILSLFFAGLILGDWKVVYWRWANPLTNSEQFCINYLGQFFAGLVALPALIQGTLKWYDLGPIGSYLAVPSPNELNGLYPRLGSKFVEMGYLYTTIAGLLNILAIFDALEGPATRAEAPADAKLPTTAITITPPAAATAPAPGVAP